MIRVLWITCCLLPPSLAYPIYQEQIPNANRVAHPCKPNYRWPGVGHKNSKGGGNRNQFGIDFQKAGYKWTQELCWQDSDGDGKTNGEELGDPNCVWSQGQVAFRTIDITHPGVCDPYNSSQCIDKNSFLSCSLDAFEGCDAIKNPGVTLLDLKFNLTQVPASVTNYMCMTFDLPVTEDYHIIAAEPLISNQHVLHHIMLFACSDGVDFEIRTPTSCGMTSGSCVHIICGWTVGMPGQCFGPKSGYRIGPTGYKRVLLQVHYNNPNKVSTYTDASGMRLHIQPAVPEVQDMATLLTGQTMLMIPPGQKRVVHVGQCPSDCSRLLLNKPVYVLAALNHMHYLGFAMTVELFRAGVKVADITNEDAFNYDSPVTINHDPHIEIRPGDEIKTTCVYNSMSTDSYVYFGTATSDEMCFGFLYTYPKDAYNTVSECDSMGPLSACDYKTDTPVDGCDWKAFTDTSNPNTSLVYETLSKKCSLNGFCRPECRKYLMTLKDHPCLNGEIASYVKLRMEYSYEGMKFLGYLTSCNLTDSQSSRCHQPGGVGKMVLMPFILFFSIISHIIFI